MSEERKINGINEFLQMSMTNNMPLSVNEKRQIFDLIIDLQKQLQQKENIIKEAREYIDRYEINSIGTPLTYTQLGKELLEILDKAGDSNERNKDNK